MVKKVRGENEKSEDDGFWLDDDFEDAMPRTFFEDLDIEDLYQSLSDSVKKQTIITWQVLLPRT